MSVTIRALDPETDRDPCLRILRGLPAWFGIEEGIEEAVDYITHHHGLIAERAGTVVGFLTWDRPFPTSAEITWMAVAADHHRRGIGRLLIDHLLAELREAGAELLSVKTLAESHPSPEYARTRAFYAGMGFRPLMILPDLWDPANPCLVMVRPLA